MLIHCKEGEAPIDPTWVKAWNDLFLDVDQQILKAQSWAADCPNKRPTKRGLRRFLGNWIRRSCPVKPAEAIRRMPEPLPPLEPLEARKAHLERLRAMLK